MKKDMPMALSKTLGAILLEEASKLPKDDGFKMMTEVCASLAVLPMFVLQDESHERFREVFCDMIRKRLAEYSEFSQDYDRQ